MRYVLTFGDGQSGDAFKRQKGSLQNYLEQAVHNRHILPVQRSHQRLSPLTESLPRALAKSQSANVEDFQKLYGGLRLRSLSRAATASHARRNRAMSRSLRIARERGITFGKARPDTTLSMSRAELRELRQEEAAGEFARDLLQARAISRLSPRVTKDQPPGYTPFDAFGDMQTRPLTSTAALRRYVAMCLLYWWVLIALCWVCQHPPHGQSCRFIVVLELRCSACG